MMNNDCNTYHLYLQLQRIVLFIMHSCYMDCSKMTEAYTSLLIASDVEGTCSLFRRMICLSLLADISLPITVRHYWIIPQASLPRSLCGNGIIGMTHIASDCCNPLSRPCS